MQVPSLRLGSMPQRRKRLMPEFCLKSPRDRWRAVVQRVERAGHDRAQGKTTVEEMESLSVSVLVQS